jgi:hypothetical protein
LILACLAAACFDTGPGDEHIIPIDSSGTGTSGGEVPFACGELECSDAEVCVEDAVEPEPSHRCVSTAACATATVPDCECLEALCAEGLECVAAGVPPGKQFSCQPPSGTTTG